MSTDLIKSTMLSDGVTDLANWTVPAATMKTAVSEGVTDIHEQLPNQLVLALLAVTVLYLLRNCKLRHAWVIPAGYLMADVYMAVLHMFLDHPRSRECPVDFLKDLALDFQNHHRNPFQVVVSNHVSAIDLLNTATLGSPLFWAVATKILKGKSLPPQVILFGFATTCGGILGAYNHVCCHARTHKVPIPEIMRMGQDYGFFPHNEFHRKHHTPPHADNFAFLVGGAPVYDYLYLQLQNLVVQYYEVMAVLFTLVQPFVVSSLVAVYVLLRREVEAPKAKTA